MFFFKNEVEVLENTEGMTNQEGIRYLERIILISDVIILGCNTTFSELEQEKNLPNGAIVRQALRLAFTFAVKNCLDNKLSHLSGMFNVAAKTNEVKLAEIVHETKLLANRDPVEILMDLQLNSVHNSNPTDISYVGAKIYSDSLLQSVDILRLKAILYRDVVRNDRNKAKPFVIVVLYINCAFQI